MTGTSRSKLLTTVAAAGLAATFAGGALAADPVAAERPAQRDAVGDQFGRVQGQRRWQAFDLAKIRLDEALADKTWTAATEQTGDYQDKPAAVILDADETAIDNGAYEVLAGQGGQGLQRQDLG